MWGVHRETSIEDIVNDLAESNIKIESTDIQRKSKDDSAVHSYKISVPAADLEKALCPDIWPMRVKVREYVYYPRKKVEDNKENEESKRSTTEEVTGITNLQNTPNPTAQISEQNVITTFNRFDPLNTDAAKKDL